MRKRKKRREEKSYWRETDLKALVEARLGSLKVLEDLGVRTVNVALEMIEA
jgi:hypothetical protein